MESCQSTVYIDPTSRDAQLSHLRNHSDSLNTTAAIFLPCLSIANSPYSRESDASASSDLITALPTALKTKCKPLAMVYKARHELDLSSLTRSFPLFASLSIPTPLLFLLFHEPTKQPLWGPALVGPPCEKFSLQASQSQLVPCV